MDKYTIGYSCLNCMWNDQCHYEQFCEFHDDGNKDVYLSDIEIKQFTKNERNIFRNEYWKYIERFYRDE